MDIKINIVKLSRGWVTFKFTNLFYVPRKGTVSAIGSVEVAYFPVGNAKIVCLDSKLKRIYLGDNELTVRRGLFYDIVIVINALNLKPNVKKILGDWAYKYAGENIPKIRMCISGKSSSIPIKDIDEVMKMLIQHSIPFYIKVPRHLILCGNWSIDRWLSVVSYDGILLEDDPTIYDKLKKIKFTWQSNVNVIYCIHKEV